MPFRAVGGMSIGERPEALEAINRAEAELAEVCGQHNALAAKPSPSPTGWTTRTCGSRPAPET